MPLQLIVVRKSLLLPPFPCAKGRIPTLRQPTVPLLIVRRDKGFDKIEQLRGKTLSLTDPASTSGALLPRKAVSQLTGTLLESYFQRVTFAGSHDRAIDAVQTNLVDAAFVSSTRLDEALRRGTILPDEIGVLWQSSPIPYDPVVLS